MGIFSEGSGEEGGGSVSLCVEWVYGPRRAREGNGLVEVLVDAV
jgi:hypothetical protein